MTDLDAQRRFFAEEIQVTANLKSDAVVQAFSEVPRERFLPPGPWTIRSEADFMAPLRQTRDDDPRHVYHNIAVAIDSNRMLFNGVPSLLSMAIDSLTPAPGDRILHIGTGLGYYTAIMAHCVGSTGRVVGIEVDEALAAEARTNLAAYPWLEMRQGDGLDLRGETFDAILVNAGVTHPQTAWLDALSPTGRLILPLTAAMPSPIPGGTAPAMPTIGKGLMIRASRTSDPDVLDARVLTFVGIYSALGLRDDALNAVIGQALGKNPFPAIKILRRTTHDPSSSCWLHGNGFCFATS